MPEVVRWSDTTLQEFKSQSQEQQAKALFIEEHPDYPAYLLVNSFDPLFAHNLKEVIGEYRAVNKLNLDKLFEAADEYGYTQLIYVNDPDELYSFMDSLDDPYPFELGVTLKQFQLRGFNYTKDLPSAIINWSTGTGKSVYAVARAKYLLRTGKVDKVVVFSKSHNKVNWKRTFAEKGGLVAEVDDENESGATPAKKRERRAEMYETAEIFITNYEKMRFRPDNEKVRHDASGRKRPSASGDGQELLIAFKDKRVLWVWDEMPTKMKGMQTAWYKGAQKILGKTAENWQIELTATKIERDPENVYACTKILDKTVWPNLATFRNSYAKRMSQFAQWQVASWDKSKLHEMGMRLAHITHVADKYTDPAIAAEFPKDQWETIELDMSPADRKLYEAAKQAIVLDSKGNNFGLMNRLAPLQLICNNPLTLAESESQVAKVLAAEWKLTDSNSAKLDYLRGLLDTIDGKVVIFSAFNDLGAKMLLPYLTKWGHSWAYYGGTKKQMQAAHDRFRTDRRVKVFVSSDQGSDSIDLEQATVVVNYDLPANASTLTQRVNRISRITSEHTHVFYINLVMAQTIEERKLALIAHKQAMEDALNVPLIENAELVTASQFSEFKYLLS